MLRDESGVIAIVTAICITMLLGFAALSLDTSHLVITHNELQNAADAAALAGARALYNANGDVIQDGALTLADGSTFTHGCNEVAYQTALTHNSNNIPVEVNCDLANNTGDVQRGHWSFGRGPNVDKGFYPSSSTAITTLIGVSDAALDDDLNFINAVRVTTRRESSPISGFFSKILGKDNFTQTATAVAYLGFAGSFDAYDLDIPIAICFESIVDSNGAFQCNIGRMINSGSNTVTHNSGGWTDFDQSGDCNGVNSTVMKNVATCDNLSGNQSGVEKGLLESGGGENQVVFDQILNCWKSVSTINDGDDTNNVSWEVKLPVILCPGNNIGNCSELVGGVTVELVWITRTEPGSAENPNYSDTPVQMDNWTYDGFDEDGDGDSDGKDRWLQFVDNFQMKDANGDPAPYLSKSIYFKPSCSVAIPSGGTGGANLGVLAEIPVLVD